jgi:lipopolysaccharide/colanic/teichoic acid biosynthesis glycosyltransferase
MQRLSERVVKRTVDILVSASVLIVMAPIMLIVAVAIFVESPGPLFYRARRVGYRGRPLAMLKFRKMHPQARGAALTVANDARLTRVGAFLTKTRLDEIPQLWHVLRGEMSLIGPRPEDPDFVARRPQDYEEILQVRPGITGLSQLAFAEERVILPPDDPISYYVDRLLPQKCAIDRLYARQASLATDLRIVAWTLIALVLRRPVAVHRGTGRLSVRRRPAARPVRRDEPATSAASRS